MVIQWMRRTSAVWLIASVACGSGSLEPEPLPLDRVECARCGMMVSELAHAAQAVAPGDEPRFYDDRGCLAKDASALPADARLFVQLDGGKGWIEVQDAYFAIPAEARTPMGYGVTAFRAEEDAARADRAGRALRWADVVRELDTP
jgi:copper chaperone NosL